MTTVSQLVTEIKQKIDDLHGIVDVLLQEYKLACDIIDPEIDRRQVYLKQLQELEETLTNLVETHPTTTVDKMCQNMANVMTALAAQQFEPEKESFTFANMRVTHSPKKY